MRAIHRFALLSLLVVLLPALARGQGGGAFEVRFDEQVFPSGFSGDVIVALAPIGGREPRRAMHSWFGAPPSMRFHVEDLAAGDSVVLSHAGAEATFPRDWWSVEPSDWSVQVIARVSRVGRSPGLDAGDVYSAPLDMAYDPASEETVTLTLDKVVQAAPFAETDRLLLFEYESDALSEFHDSAYLMRAGVLLPVDHDPEQAYPVVYIVTGFGGTHDSIHRWAGMISEDSPLNQAIIVVPDATNRYGHSVFCDSPSIGPWGEALVRELIPALEADFGGAGAEHRYVTGVSSGGWSSLWLQVAYPDEFAGCWSHAPDPIDFHDFQRIDLYTPLEDGSPRNMYVDEEGTDRAILRGAEENQGTYRDFVAHEHVLNPGGQVRSFEATFSPRAADGTPRRVFDVETGDIDHELAQTWRPYDISHQLLTRWDELRGSLAGKIHVYAGEQDNFYLEGAVRRFRALADEAGLLDEMEIEVIPGMPHTLHAPGHQQMIDTLAARWMELEDA